MRYAFHFVHSPPPNQPHNSGSHQSLYLLVGKCFQSILQHALTRGTVLSIIQEKVNNPSPDDPFEPDIAAVSLYLTKHLILTLNDLSQLLKNDKSKFLATAKEWTKK